MLTRSHFSLNALFHSLFCYDHVIFFVQGAYDTCRGMLAKLDNLSTAAEWTSNALARAICDQRPGRKV